MRSTKYWSPSEWTQMKKVNLGCGNKPMAGFLNVDNRTDLQNVEYPGVDLCNLSCFENNSVDYVYACHVVEHIPTSKTMQCLSEIYRILKPGGMFRIAVPDFDAVVKYYQEQWDLESVHNWIYGSPAQEVKNEYRHYRIFNMSMLRTLLFQTGFKRISRYDATLTNHSTTDDFSFARIPHMSNDSNAHWLSLNLESYK